jgi:hypothetical protein
VRRAFVAAILIACIACARSATPSGAYLVVWAGDSAAKASDFLAVIDANPASPRYGAVLASLPTGTIGTHPHHTEAEMPADGNVLATFQYKADSAGRITPHMHEEMTRMPMPKSVERTTGGLVEMDERGTVIRASSAADTAIADTHIYPYSVLALPTLDRAVSTTTDMDDSDTKATAQWVQFWKLSDRTLLKGFQGEGCGVPILAGHFWLQPVPEAHTLVSLDITDPEHPHEVSTVKFGDDEFPHWIAIDGTGRRVVLNSGGYGESDRLFIVNLDTVSGALSIDERFRDPGSTRPGINLSARTWPHGFVGTAAPHGTVFSR